MVGHVASHVGTRPGHRPALPAEVAEEIRLLVEPGDVFITRKNHRLTNYFFPGYWVHAALYLGDAASLERLGIHEHPEVRPRWHRLLTSDGDEPRRVLEALEDGVRLRSLHSPLRCDALVVLRPRLSRDDVAQAPTRALVQEGKPYDFDFDFTRSDRLVCTEVIYRSYGDVGGIRFELTRRAGRLTLAAEDLLRVGVERGYFEPVALFAPAFVARLVTGCETRSVLRVSLQEPDADALKNPTVNATRPAPDRPAQAAVE